MDRESEAADLRGQGESESGGAVLPVSARFLPGTPHGLPRKI